MGREIIAIAIAYIPIGTIPDNDGWVLVAPIGDVPGTFNGIKYREYLFVAHTTTCSHGAITLQEAVIEEIGKLGAIYIAGCSQVELFNLWYKHQDYDMWRITPSR